MEPSLAPKNKIIFITAPKPSKPVIMPAAIPEPYIPRNIFGTNISYS